MKTRTSITEAQKLILERALRDEINIWYQLEQNIQKHINSKTSVGAKEDLLHKQTLIHQKILRLHKEIVRLRLPDYVSLDDIRPYNTP